MHGVVRVQSAKNACLPILAATVLVTGKTIIRDVPKIRDVENLLHILSGLGARVKWHNGDVHLETTNLFNNEINHEAAKKIRGSIFLLGSILGRFKSARLPFPGGCKIGARPIDLHLGGLRDIGVTVKTTKDYITCTTRKISGGVVYLDFPSVGATENLILASALGRSTIKIVNAAREPEVVDLCNFLQKCGARICGEGTDTITVHGTNSLVGVDYRPIPDRINAGSYMLAAATVGGDVTVQNIRIDHNANLIRKLEKSGVELRLGADFVRIKTTGKPHKNVASVQTAAFPGFSTDLQSQFAVFAATGNGECAITENLFESRFRYLPELEKFGVRTCTKGRVAAIHGGTKLTAGTTELPLHVEATDLRGGVAMVIAGLSAKGKTTVTNAEQIARGHEDIVRDFAKLGADITWS